MLVYNRGGGGTLALYTSNLIYLFGRKTLIFFHLPFPNFLSPYRKRIFSSRDQRPVRCDDDFFDDDLVLVIVLVFGREEESEAVDVSLTTAPSERSCSTVLLFSSIVG